MRTAVIILTLCLSACEPQFTLSLSLPDIEVPIPCALAPGDCDRSDEEFAQKFDAMSDTEQSAYVDKWAAPREGFVAKSGG